MADIRWIGPFTSDEVTIGRNRTCTVVLEDSSVSREHARLVRDEAGWVLGDLGSANGTWVRGRRITQVVLRAGETFYVGDLALAIEEPAGDPAAREVPAAAEPRPAASSTLGLVAFGAVLILSLVCLAIAGGLGYWLWSGRTGAVETAKAAPSSPAEPTPRPAVALPSDGVHGLPVAERSAVVVSNQGGQIALPSGAALTVDAGFASAAPIELRRVERTSRLTAFGARTDLYVAGTGDRPKRRPDTLLRIPVAPDVEAAALQAYWVGADGEPVPVASRVEGSALVIPHARVNVEPTSDTPLAFHARERLPEPPGGGGGGYFGAVPRAPIQWTCQKGAYGEFHEEPGQMFRIVVRTPTTCELVRYVALTLQEALQTYEARFPTADKSRRFGFLTPENRMWVYLYDSGSNGQYRFESWTGWITVNAALGNDRAVLRDTLFHEMFHAVQDTETNMFLGGNLARWWYESTAEWAGRTYSASPDGSRPMDFAAGTVAQLTRFDYVLSVPVTESAGVDPDLPYADSLLVAWAERRRPGYAARELAGSNTTSRALYEQLVTDGDLTHTYPDFLREVMTNAPPTGPWALARILETNGERRIVRANMGDTAGVTELLATREQRAAPMRFKMYLPPLTAKFIQLSLDISAGRAVNSLTTPRRVRVSMVAEGGTRNPDGFLVTSANVGRGRQPIPGPLRGEVVPGGYGRDFKELWVVAYNPDAGLAAEAWVTITIEEPGGTVDLSGSWQDKYGACIAFTQSGTKAGGTVTYANGTTGQIAGDVKDRTYTFTFSAGADRGDGTMSANADPPTRLDVNFKVNGKASQSVSFDKLPGACPKPRVAGMLDCYDVCLEHCHTFGDNNFGPSCNKKECCERHCKDMQGVGSVKDRGLGNILDCWAMKEQKTKAP